MVRLTYYILPAFLFAGLVWWITPQQIDDVSLGADTSATFPGTCTALDTGAAGDWTDATNAQTDNDTGAAWGAGSSSDILSCTNFGFEIPIGATIDGIVVNIKGRETSGGNTSVSSMRLVQDGETEVGDNNAADDVTDWNNDAYEIKEHGTPADLWGLSLDADDINSSTFGIAHRSTKASAGATNVDYISMTVYYTEALEATAASGYIRSSSMQVRSGQLQIR